MLHVPLKVTRKTPGEDDLTYPGDFNILKKPCHGKMPSQDPIMDPGRNRQVAWKTRPEAFWGIEAYSSYVEEAKRPITQYLQATRRFLQGLRLKWLT